jgi:hypothetical protein
MTNQVKGIPLTDELKTVFGFFGEVTGLIVHRDGKIEVHYGGRFKIDYIPVVGLRGYL